MKIDNDGRIAFSGWMFRDDKRIEFVQYDFDGSVDWRSAPFSPTVTRMPPLTETV